MVNSMAKREVIKTSRFTGLIKPGKCGTVKKTSGDTKHSVDAIKEIAETYAHQTKDLAKALRGNTVAETVDNNYKFLYSHFQYQADPRLQHMRSPICSWADRFTGIDCKSFSIFSSSLLLMQGIGHFIRRIKQPSYNSENWTHVYVVVPKNQKTLSLNEGYYIIDATLHNNIESNYSLKHDTLMSKLPHVWLNGPGPSNDNSIELAVLEFNAFLQKLADNAYSSSVIKQVYEVINSFLSQNIIPEIKFSDTSIFVNDVSIPSINTTSGLAVSLNDFAGIFGSGWRPSCFGGTYSQTDLNKANPLIVEGFNALYDSFNASLSSNDQLAVLASANAILSASKAFQDHTARTANHDWSSSCSRATTAVWRDMGVFYSDLSQLVFFAYLQRYFNLNTAFKNVSNVSYPFNTRVGSDGLKKDNFVIGVDVPQINSLQFKGEDVPFFEATPYVLENLPEGNFNLENFINTLNSIAVQFGNSGSNQGGGPGNTAGSNNGSPIVPPGTPPNVNEASLGTISLVILGGVAAKYGYDYFKNQKSKSTK